MTNGSGGHLLASPIETLYEVIAVAVATQCPLEPLQIDQSSGRMEDDPRELMRNDGR